MVVAQTKEPGKETDSPNKATVDPGGAHDTHNDRPRQTDASF